MMALLETILVFIMLFCPVTLVLTRGYIFQNTKNWIIGKAPQVADVYLDYLFNCAMCAGFWVGIAGWFVYPIKVVASDFINCVLAGFVCSAFSILLDRFIYGEGE